MNKPTIDNDVYERYVDATVALFMEYYSVISLPESIQEEFVDINNEFIFPTELDNRCRLLIKRECARYRLKRNIKNIGKGFQYIAACAVVMLSLCSLLFMTVEAVRIPIINYYIENFDGHWEISGQEIADSPPNEDTIDMQNPLHGLIPEEYQLTVLEGDSLTDLNAIYENAAGKRVYLLGMPGDSWVAVDSENADLSQKCQINGCDAILVVKDGVNLTWIHKESSIMLSLFSDGLTENEVISIAEQLIEKISQ